MNINIVKLAKTPSRYSMLLRSIVYIIFGSIILLFPALSLWFLAVAFAVNLLIIGLFMIFEPTMDRTNNHAVLTAITGVVSVLAGVYLLARPLASIFVITIIFALWALLFGLADLMLAFSSSKGKSAQSWLFYVAGAISIVFAIFILFNPIEGSLAVVWSVGLYSLAIGIISGYNAIVHMKDSNKNMTNKSKTKGKK